VAKGFFEVCDDLDVILDEANMPEKNER